MRQPVENTRLRWINYDGHIRQRRRARPGEAEVGVGQFHRIRLQAPPQQWKQLIVRGENVFNQLEFVLSCRATREGMKW